jgi:hypothetical protein
MNDAYSCAARVANSVYNGQLGNIQDVIIRCAKRRDLFYASFLVKSAVSTYAPLPTLTWLRSF